MRFSLLNANRRLGHATMISVTSFRQQFIVFYTMPHSCLLFVSIAYTQDMSECYKIVKPLLNNRIQFSIT